MCSARSPSSRTTRRRNGEIWPVLVQGWTLNYEMFFYAVFACVLLLPAKARLAALAGGFGALVLLGLLVDSDNPLFTTYTDPLILEFLAGAMIGKLWLDKAIPSPVIGIVLIIAALAGFAFVGITYVGFDALVFGPLAAALLIGVLALEKAGAVQRLRPAAYLGDSSYSIYLWHTMAISVVAKAAAMFSMPAAVTLAVAVVAGVVVGAACHEILEKPLAALLRKRQHRKEQARFAV